MKMLPYISLDLETTGIDYNTCQIIEIGAVFDFPDRPLADCPRFHRYVRHKLYVGEPFALNLNSRIFGRLAEEPAGFEYACVDDVPYLLAAWIKDCGWDMKARKVTFAGKNFGAFDLAFLKRLQGFDSVVRYNWRIFDPGSMYFDPAIDELPPGTAECLRRAGLQHNVAHEALADAEAVCKLIRVKYGIPI